MSHIWDSLRFKLALTFAIFGAAISLLLSLGISYSTTKLGERLMDETLKAEIDGYLSRHRHNPNAQMPSTISLHGYVQRAGSAQNIPPELRSLADGKYQMKLSGVPYRVAVLSRDGARYFMLFNETQQRRREATFRIYLVTGALAMILFSAFSGWWLAGRIVAPIAELARRVDNASAEEDAGRVAQGFANDEIGRLAQVFALYLKRMRAFIDRERDFTADVSHELRTPLSIVQGVVELMEEDSQLHEKQQERIARIGRANREMINTTSALLLMARERTDTTASCDAGEVIAAAIEMNRHLLSANTTVQLCCLAQPQVCAESALLNIVASNLIRNAFIHTPSGSVSVLLDADSLTVSDTGTGIPGSEIGKVFQRHFKGMSSTGSGIGLSLVKRICERYGWETLIESAEGQGTSVRLFFTDNRQISPSLDAGATQS